MDLVGVIKSLIFVIAGQTLLYIICRFLTKFAGYMKTTIDDRIIKATRRLSSLTILLMGMYLAIPSLDLPSYSSEISTSLYYAVFMLIVFISARVLAIMIDKALEKVGVSEDRRNATTKIVKIAVLSLGFIGILSYYLNLIMPFAASLGIIGFALTLSLQYPLANFIGWVYIMTSKIFREGNLVRIGEYRGSILSIGYLTTKIADIGDFGKPSGRILTIPNSTTLTTNVLTWANPFFWDSVSFTLAYESDLKHVREIMLKTVKSVLEDQKLSSMSKDFENFYEEIGFDREGMSIEPYVVFEPVGGGWVSAKLLYLTPFEASLKIKTLVTERILEAFNAESDRIKFPVGRSR